MSKGDVKKDYYAALGVPPDADLDTIKKRFRVLAMQMHPDRNFGNSKEATEKFVEVQEAYAVLNDKDLRDKYDNDRAKYLRKTQPDLHPFKRAQTTKVPPPNPGFQPPPKSRNASVDRSQFARTRTQPSSASAEKFAAFTRAAPQQWDRAKFEEAAAKADALRNFQSMRSGQPPPHPPRPPRAPTAPKSNSSATSPEFMHANVTSPGFPGLSRTQSARRSGFSPAIPGDDEPQAKSAYAHLHGSRERPRSYQNPPPQPPTPTSPAGYRPHVTDSNLKPSYSSSGLSDAQRPTFGRTPSRYAANSGEKTNINGVGIGRSASVRASPVDRTFAERGPFGARSRASQEFHQPPPRHHSASPKLRGSDDAGFEFSATETSSSEDELPRDNRPKAVPRPTRLHPHDRTASNDPALTGQFSDKNYTRIVDDTQYHFPPPQTRDVPHRRLFNEIPTPVGDLAAGLNAAGLDDGHHEFPRPSRSSPNLHDPSQAPPGSNSARANPFKASEWDGKFTNNENIFAPNERDRKSPSKNSRTRQTGKSKGQPIDIDWDDEVSPTNTTDQRYRARPSQQNDSFSKPTSVTADSSENVKPYAAATASSNETQEPKPWATSVPDEADGKHPQTGGTPEPMDIDSNGSEHRTSIPSIHVQPGSRRTSGVDLSDLKDTFPLKPSADGLDSLSSDLANSLPFKSRPAENVQLYGPSGAALRGMSLPKPPKPILAPDNITQESWESYWKRMQQYMRDWSTFNVKMIDHFRLRQEQVDHNMYQNWVMGEGEGANAQDVDGSDITSPPGPMTGDHPHKKAKAGYHTYMQWLEQDALCRTWWDEAFEEHRQCLNELGRMRRTVKAIRDRQGT